LFLRHDIRIDLSAVVPDEFDVTPSLAGFNDTSRLKSPLDLSKGCGLSRPNLDLDGPHLRGAGSLRGFVVELDGFGQIRESFFLALALTGNIDLQTLRNIPVPLAPNSRGKWSLHVHYCFT
jgi:hypothetical protein